MANWQDYYQPTTLSDALDLLREHAGAARIVAGGTDVLVELSRAAPKPLALIDITRLRELKYVRRDGDLIRIGGLATHNDLLASAECLAAALPLAQACLELGAPQIRARATLAGNLVTASPANDTIAPLLALGAELTLASATGERAVALAEFSTGFRQTVLRADELVREVCVPALHPKQRGLFIKLGLRRAQAISVINLAIVLTLDGDTVAAARIAMGCLAPTVVRARTAEEFLVGRRLDSATCAEAGRLACFQANPIGDVRGSAAYRLATLRALLADGLARIAAGRERDGWPARVVRLETATGRGPHAEAARGAAADRRAESRTPKTLAEPQPIGGPQTEDHGSASQARDTGKLAAGLSSVTAVVNGAPAALDPHKTLLDALREDAGLTGAKLGCAEGECGACTVWLGGQAVMACLTPAAQAHGMHVTTIEGLAGYDQRPHAEGAPGAAAEGWTEDRAAEPESAAEVRAPRPSVAGLPSAQLHPLQRAFVRHAAVQCGYCIPGMIMAGAKLLDELAAPGEAEIRSALSGNICRCTGYRKIIDAVRAAAGERGATCGLSDG